MFGKIKNMCDICRKIDLVTLDLIANITKNLRLTVSAEPFFRPL